MENKEIKCLDKGFVRLVDSMGDDSAIVQAARVSYGKGTKKVSEDEGLIRYLLRNKHTTPFEMVQFKFHIKAPIFVFRQWHRHRMWSYNEYSGRYSEMKDEFYVPDDNLITKQNPNNKQGGSNEIIDEAFTYQGSFISEQVDARSNYEMYLKTGMRKELARINLPLAQYSEMYATVDLHNLFHFLKLRMDSHAQYEIRVYGDALGELIKPIVPIAYQAFEDYVLNSMTLNQKEILGISKYINLLQRELNYLQNNIPDDVISNLAETPSKVYGEELFENKREREEFIAKFDRILNQDK